MTYYPLQSTKPPAAPIVATAGPFLPSAGPDILWNKPVFKAPALPNLGGKHDPLPFRATRITQRRARA